MTKKENNRLEQKIRNKIEKEGRLVDNNKNKILKSYLFLLEKSIGIPTLAEVSSYSGLSTNTCLKHLKNIVGDIQSSNNFEANALRQLLMKKISDKALFEGDVKALRLAAECTGMLNQQQQNQVMNQQVIYEVRGEND
tara:strand:- start:291 stop:704 length:414 start_codon:yes stop_codon:yes gene_type:complete